MTGAAEPPAAGASVLEEQVDGFAAIPDSPAHVVKRRLMKMMEDPRAAPKKPLAPYIPSAPPSSTGGS